ncbi:PREDICTED: myb family transcription factor EFM-like isoform X2 [Tarenaya hassleriana]|uniref:myb family transcription factor EFM-like isoform X2 n=1 Tax=Tarenaya hassleriana TaxID=28532 RepID=UPI00053C9CB5|nr:PREDICTED: myb family transcription factor EFM-like isoform X2 [Tarenaya hassleriana]
MVKSINKVDYTRKRQTRGECIETLEEERRKILVFQREFPLCLELVTQTIEACKREMSGTAAADNMNSQWECSEQTNGEYGRPILEEFMPIKRSSSGDEHGSHRSNGRTDDSDTKSDWLKSVQLWNQPDQPTKEERLQEKETVVGVERNGKENRKTPETETIGGGDGMKNEAEKDVGVKRKQRRYWSRDLHRRFLNALQQLGGAHAATPKQIRGIMKVGGLTNDQVKSHLQKYRLHTRGPSQVLTTNVRLHHIPSAAAINK